MKLCLVGDTAHSWDAQGRLCTLSPVVRQLRPWLERFEEVVFCGTQLSGPPPAHHEPYPQQNVRLIPLPAGGGNHLRAKVGLGQRVFQWLPLLRRVLRGMDVVHFRCPCNIGLVGLLAAQGLPLRRFAMYAGNWGGYPGESPFYRLQRAWLNSPRYRGTTAVYGEWNRQPAHVLTSFSPSFTDAEWSEETASVDQKLRSYLEREQLEPLRLVSVGHLSADKNQASLLRAVALLRHQQLSARVELLGDGPERARLEDLTRTLELTSWVQFRGRVSLQEVRAAYRSAHVGVLASRTEGFPKVLAEAMCGGAVPVASDVGINAQLVGKGRGLLFPFDDAPTLAQRLAQLARQPHLLRELALAGREYTRVRTLEAFWALQEQVLSERLGVPERLRPLEVAS